MLFAVVSILATRWRYLHYLQVWPTGCLTCIVTLPWIAYQCKWRHLVASDHVTCIAWFQIWPPGCVTHVATLPWNALLTLSVSVEFVSLSARVTSVKSAQVA